MTLKQARLLIFFVFLFLPVLTQVSLAENICVLPEMRINQRPGGAEGGPTEILLGVITVDITSVDDVAQTLSGDFIVVTNWQDGRLEGQVGCRFPISKVWSPRLELINSANLKQKYTFQRDQVKVEHGGWIRYYQRFTGSVSTHHHLARFPFDKQNFRLRVASAYYAREELTLNANKDLILISDLINIPDWTIGEPQASVTTLDMFKMGQPRDIFVLDIPATRKSQFYVWKILVPLTLIVMMSWVVFWINPVRFGPQLGLSATAMLTLIAFQFAQTGVLPKLCYFTIMDRLILGSSLLVFMSFYEAATAIYLVAKGAEKHALNLDLVCRWLFPLIFIIYWTAVIFI